MVGRPGKSPHRTWYPTPENDTFIETLYAASPDFDQSALINLLLAMVRVNLKGSVLDALMSSRWDGRTREDAETGGVPS